MRISDWSSDVCSSDLSDFKLLHPGGALGKRLLRVADLMHGAEALPLCGPDTVMSEAILVMTAGHFGCVGIVDDSRRLIGIVTDGDLRRHMNHDIKIGRATSALQSLMRISYAVFCL